MMAKRLKAFRRAAMLLSAAAWLRRHIFIAMSIIMGALQNAYRFVILRKEMTKDLSLEVFADFPKKILRLRSG